MLARRSFEIRLAFLPSGIFYMFHPILPTPTCPGKLIIKEITSNYNQDDNILDISMIESTLTCLHLLDQAKLQQIRIPGGNPNLFIEMEPMSSFL